MSSSRLSQLLNLTKKSLPIKLTQNSKLTIQTPKSFQLPIHINLLPQWRDDGHLTLEQSSSSTTTGDENQGNNVDWKVDVKEGKKAGLTDVNVLIDYKNNLITKNDDDGDLSKHEVTTKHSPQNQDNPISDLSHVTITAEIPEKCNVTCLLKSDIGGNITVKGKLEAEDGFHFSTQKGNIVLDKLRGDTIELNCEHQGLIHVKKSCESQHLKVNIGQGGGGGRLRSKMLNVSNANIDVQEARIGSLHDNNELFEKLDEDDGLSLIDISSIYASQSGDGVHLAVYSSESLSRRGQKNKNDERKEYPRKIRVKSHHGHLSARATTSIFNAAPIPYEAKDEFGQRSSLITLGGVNGSFDASIENNGFNQMETLKTIQGLVKYDDYPMAANIHVDSLSPGQISVFTSDSGDVGLSLDRKIESDLRLLSCPLINNLDSDLLTLDDENELVKELVIHDENMEELRKDYLVSNDADVSAEIDESTYENHRIKLETKAFSGHRLSDMTYVEFVQGSVENRSEEPDSRFDVKTKGRSQASVGKISIDEAAGQALEGFSGGGDESNFERPLVSVGTFGNIEVESLSWLGAISKRYGVKDRTYDLGRQAKKQVEQQDSTANQ